MMTGLFDSKNPANEQRSRSAVERTRVPMSLPIQKLQVPEIPGWHLHWIMGTPSRLAQAQRAGYEFVEDTEVDLNRYGVADSPTSSGNTDMGSHVSVLAGSDTADGQAARLYLMKLREELWLQDQATLEARNEQTAVALRGPLGLQDPSGDNSHRYVPKDANRNILFPKRRT